MQNRLVTLADGRTVTFELGDPAPAVEGGQTAFFVLGIRKCGSSLLNSMLNDLGRLNGFPFVDIGGGFFAANVPEQDWREDPAALNALAPNTVYGGFRAMPLVFARSPLYQASRKILLVRDPRDALVSEYFSIAFSHGLPDEAAGEGGAREEFLALREQTLASHIETVVLERAGILCETFLEYAEAHADKLTRTYRYEDVILDKRPWLAGMAEHFGWHTGSPAFVNGMMGWADRVPTEEQSHEFIRRVVPGDHRNKLRPAVIQQLNVILRPAMELFGYR
jgi:hypothetical protein